jgi:hypothetical protein
MLINWKRKKAGLNVVPIMKGGQVVKYVTLLRGINEVSEEDWEGMRKNLKRHLKVGNIEIVSEKVEVVKQDKDGKKEKSEKIVFDLSGLTPKKAVETVKDTWNLDTLKGWLDKEGRDEVRAAIANQVENVENPKRLPPKKEE